MDAQKLELAQAELDRLEFAKLLREAQERNDGSYLALAALLCINAGQVDLLDGYTADDYQKAIKVLQYDLERFPSDELHSQSAIDYIRTNFLNGEVKSDA